ncbi:uncharacterized protein LOC132045207 [Lycium ferocissimum]|uniref:uncharacterized protein LOC132045207 n=1 Tax=Lycium ferocissimum TaxID=112874 RepID=UPI0028159C0C|nr:uncharacterized protein LOC132045207 [Lycium ferocissimum]
MHEDEKIGGLPVYPDKYEDFAFCVNSSELFEVSFKGSLFTWWNGRAGRDCIFKRLDRMLTNSKLQDWFGHMEVEHLSRTGSDHAPLLLTCGNSSQHLSLFLSEWSKATFGDIFKQLVVREDIVRVKEQFFEDDPSPANRMVLQLAQAELKKYMHYEEEFWRQKSHFTCFSEGDGNTRFFHNMVNGRRKRLQVKRMKKQNFTQEDISSDFSLLQHVPNMVTQEKNQILTSMPTLEDVKNAVFDLSGDSSGGPDDFLPNSITHTNLVVIPKKNNVETFADMRPISLSNFINKVISRVVQNKLENVLPSLISTNQSGFVKGRCIIENVLSTQEVVSDIKLRGKPANVVLKLDVAKAYDRVSWDFLARVLRKMGFAEVFIDMIWRLIANNWYSVLFNGQASGFFHSTRGVKQGDPLSPALFILSAEVLSRALNSLFEDNGFRSYGMPKWSANLNHLAYADDTIIFSSAYATSLQLIMGILQEYEQMSGQLINKGKSSFHMHSKVANMIVQ